MAKIEEGQEEHHVLRLVSDSGNEELILVSGGKRAYLWSRDGTYSGQQSLRKFAKAILNEIPRKKS